MNLPYLLQGIRRPMIAKVETVISIIRAITALQNYTMHRRKFGEHEDYCPVGYAKVDWRDNETEMMERLLPLSNAGSNNYFLYARQIRDSFRGYFPSPEGSVTWQFNAVMRKNDQFDD